MVRPPVLFFVIPGHAKREPGIHFSAVSAARWIL
jgi:hypothetical protein